MPFQSPQKQYCRSILVQYHSPQQIAKVASKSICFFLYKKSQLLLPLESRICKLRADVKREFLDLGENLYSPVAKAKKIRSTKSEILNKFEIENTNSQNENTSNILDSRYPLPVPRFREDRLRGHKLSGNDRIT
jgi:hypothetical protein